MFREGDIVEIPLPDGRVAIGWILYVSKYFKNCVGFVVFGIHGQLREDVALEYDGDYPSSLTVLGPLYTSMPAIKHYGWKTIAHRPLSPDKRLLTRRDVGGQVYVGDDLMGPTNSEEQLRPMELLGMPLVYLEIEKAFP